MGTEIRGNSHRAITVANAAATEQIAERRLSAAVDDDLALLGLPGIGMAALGVTCDAAELMVARYVAGVVQRAGVADALRFCALQDAQQRGDGEMVAALGGVASGGNLSAPEDTARELVRRAVAREATRIEGGDDV
jgi:hypothetical protein